MSKTAPDRRDGPALTRRAVLGGSIAAAAGGLLLPQLVVPTASADAMGDAGMALAPGVTHVAVWWEGSDDALVELSVRSGGSWQPWQPLTVWHDGSEGDRITSGLVSVAGGDEVRVQALTGTADGLRVVPIAAGAGSAERVRAAASSPPVSDPTTTTTTTPGSTTGSTPTTQPAASARSGRVPQPPIITRRDWGADESLRSGTPEFAPITKLIVHHTVTQNDDPNPAATVRAIYAFHTQSNGWNDIGYNFLIDESGRIYEGRYARDYDTGEVPTGEDPDRNGVIGAHALNANTGSVGVALLGTFTSRQPTAAALSALAAMLSWKADRHDIDSFGSTPFAFGDGTTRQFANISGHRDTYQTECPGDRTYVLLPTMRQRVDSAVAAAYGTTRGYWIATAGGEVANFGEAPALGSMRGRSLNQPIVAMAITASSAGYWLLGRDGGVFAFGDAPFHGSTGSLQLNQPIVGLEPTPSGDGYWLVAKDGGIFAYGDANFYGSTGSIRLNQPVVAMRSTPTGKGYWLVASDGGIFAFGDALFHGSTGSLKLNSSIVGMAAARDGYWLVAHDGGVFAFDVPFRGSVPGLKLSSYAGSAQLMPTASGQGYYILGGDGGIFTFGDANFLGAPTTLTAGGRDRAVGMGLYQPPKAAPSV